MRLAAIAVSCLLLMAAAGHAAAQGLDDPPPGEELPAEFGEGGPMSAEQARHVLAEALPAAGDARYALLQRQLRAAQVLEDKPRTIELARALVDAGRGRPGGEAWVRVYLTSEFIWGASGKALEACEPFVSDKSLSLPTRAAAALRQTYFAANNNDRAVLGRLWSRADDLAKQALAQGGPATLYLPVDRLQVRSEVEQKDGNLIAATASLREAVGASRRVLAGLRERKAALPELQEAIGWLDGSQGMLVYALVRQGRPQEAIEVAHANLALWKAGQLSDSIGARWHYRLATALNATQQFEAGLAAARASDEMLARVGAAPTSHTRWLARNEIVRGLIGLKRWPEADETYRNVLAELSADALARTRAQDNRLIALLAAKSGRIDEALEVAERTLRYRTRLYGSEHPLTRESTGVRAVVRLLKGDVGGALSDYEQLFAATLDTSAGWLDLDSRGLRGFVLGLAFAEFMDYVARQALKGEALDPRLTERALQIADRSKLGAAQRALTDSTARVLAATPQLRALLEQEQVQRQAIARQFGALSAAQAQEDRLRKEVSSEAHKALTKQARRVVEDELKEHREKLKALQADVGKSRAALAIHREAIAQKFPAYADLVTPTVPGPAQLRGLLEPGEALLLIHPLPEATLVWLVGADGRRGFHASRLTAAALTSEVSGLRKLLDLGQAPAGKPPALPLARLHALYRELLAPLEPQLKGLNSLLVATDGPLASLPFAALVSAPPAAGAPPAWLARQMAVTQLPAASALTALRRVKQPAAAAKAMLGFGDPLFKRASGGSTAVTYDAEWGFRYADVPPLPDTRKELLAVATALGADPQADLVLGAAATRRAVLAASLLDRRVVAFATHGLMPGELPGISKPALAMAADADEKESPLLELDDVLTLRLNAQWVLLSACNTAAGEREGAAAMSGLVRGFFFAGARSVLATHWAVESESAAALSIATFKPAPGRTRAEGLRQAQLALINGALGGGRWAHPYYWAPYALFGDPVH